MAHGSDVINQLQRALIAAQVALLEFSDEPVSQDQAIVALETCVKEIGVRFKALKKWNAE